VRRRDLQARRAHPQNLRVAVEATMRVLKHPFRAGQLPVRGLFRMTCVLLGSALMVNVRRLTAYLKKKAAPPLDGSALAQQLAGVPA